MTQKDEDNTDNKGLNLPAIGAVTDWASQYRQNFIDIDDALKNVFADRIAKPIVEAAVIEGDVVDGQQLTKIDGAGLGINADGELVLTAEFDGIDGLTNPLVEDVNADGFDIENVGNFSSQNATVDGTTSTATLEAEDVTAKQTLQGDDLSLSNDPDNPTQFVEYNGEISDNIYRSAHDLEITANNNAQKYIKKDPDNLPTIENAVIYVSGRGESGNQFMDIVKVSGFTTDDVDQNGGEPRSYSDTNDEFTIAIDDNGENYNLTVLAEVFRVGSL